MGWVIELIACKVWVINREGAKGVYSVKDNGKVKERVDDSRLYDFGYM